jgi:hypothetical protein
VQSDGRTQEADDYAEQSYEYKQKNKNTKKNNNNKEIQETDNAMIVSEKSY